MPLRDLKRLKQYYSDIDSLIDFLRDLSCDDPDNPNYYASIETLKFSKGFLDEIILSEEK